MGWTQYMRCILSSPLVCRPLPGLGQCGSITLHSAARGASVCIVTKKASRRVGLRYFSYCALCVEATASVCCFMPKNDNKGRADTKTYSALPRGRFMCEPPADLES